MEFATSFGILLITLLVLVIFKIRRTYKYWHELGIPTLPFNYVFGHMKNVLLQREILGQVVSRSYEELKEKGFKHCGIYLFWSPVYVPIDIEEVKSIMQSDFHHFVDRGIDVNTEIDPLSAHLFTLSGKKWKLLRNKLTPTFTTGKMKMMFEILMNCAKNLETLMEKESGSTVDIKRILSRFTMDVIGSCAFGIETNSLENEKSEFLVHAKRLFQRSPLEGLRGFLILIIPSFMKLMNMRINSEEVTNFFMGVVKSTVAYREENNVNRNDFMQLLIQLKNKGQLVDDEKLSEENISSGENSLTIEELAAQAFIFFEAGFETSSSTMTFCLFELGQNEDIQGKLRREILDVLEKYDNKLSYDAIAEMEYLDKCVNETLRKYPIVPLLTRVCTKDYRGPASDFTIEKATRVFIPVYGLHHDSEYFPNPERFDPERFTEENRRSRPAFSFIPFGEGPRICIGMRFGLMQTKVGLVTLLRHYKISTNEKSFPPIFDIGSATLSFKNGVWIDCVEITP